MFTVTALLRIPQPRQDWVIDQFVQRHDKNEASWLELFMDLIYAAALFKLGTSLIVGKFEVGGIAVTAILYWTLVLTRSAIDDYVNRFYSNDLLRTMLYLFNIAGVFILVLNIDSAQWAGQRDECRMFGMLIGIIITRVSNIIIHYMAMYRNQRITRQFAIDIARWSISIILIIIDLICAKYHINPTEFEGWSYLTILVVNIQETAFKMMSLTVFRKYCTYPMDLDLAQTRWSVWMIIVFGQAMMQIITSPSLLHISADSGIFAYVKMIFSVMLMFSMSVQYFDASQRDWYEHAISHSAVAGLFWTWMQPIVGYFFFLLGVGLIIVVSDTANAGAETGLYVFDEATAAQILSWVCGITTLSLTVLRWSHALYYRTNAEMVVYILRVMFSALQVSVMAWGVENIAYVLIIHTAIAFLCFNFIDVGYDIIASITNNKESIVRHKKFARPLSSLNLATSLTRTPSVTGLNANVNNNNNNNNNGPGSPNNNKKTSAGSTLFTPIPVNKRGAGTGAGAAGGGGGGGGGGSSSSSSAAGSNKMFGGFLDHFVSTSAKKSSKVAVADEFYDLEDSKHVPSGRMRVSSEFEIMKIPELPSNGN